MHIAIIGNGISGITAARYIRKLSNHKITVISAETDYFFSRTALMYIYMGHMRFKDTKPYADWFWEKNKIDLKKAFIKKVDTDSKELITENNEKITYDKLLIATGSKPNKYGWKGQDLNGVQGLYSYQDLELLEENTQAKVNKAVIVGGGLIGIEMAEMLHSRKIPVTFLVRETNYWNNVLPNQEAKMINRHILEHGFDLKLETELKEITADNNGRVKSVITNKGEEIKCQIVGLTAGVSPSIDFLKSSNIKIDRGVLVNLNQQTNIPDVYAAGDCAQFENPIAGRRPIEQVWYTGKMQGKVAAENICGINSAYKPGHWFNSAKFLDIEYQTYGVVMPKLREGETDIYWEHTDGKKCIHMVYNKNGGKFIGINVFGIRMRHEVFDRFLRDERNIEFVLENLAAAAFDPEFFKQYESEIIKIYNAKTGKRIKLKNKRGVKAVLSLLNLAKSN